MPEEVIGLALNVWQRELNDWRMAVYPDTRLGVDTKAPMSFTPTKDQLERYLEISQDDDWWTYSSTPEFLYILQGVKP